MSANDKIEALFEQALKFRPEERGAFLAGACGEDPELRRRVEELLRADENAGGFLPTDPGRQKTIVIPVTEQPGDRIGRYKILQQIGEGGCGVVYMAEQEEPVRRRVALKVIKLGMDTKSVIARFEAERQALAMMDHPNIAKVLDAGATDTGRPFFVMELVRGVQITNYCDEAKLSTGERLDLFIQVCHAIQHAHQKGIIHRDLKPSNILVTINDGVPVPKVIDFGIAKATTGQQLTDKTLFTAFEQFIGTPAYMSPEQAVMTSLDIDTRSDIYALGVLLYELLTGKPPFDPKELLRSGFDEMRRTICEKEPERPSSRLSTMVAADLTSVAQRRQSDVPKLIHSLRGDLDWIVMKALEKDRTRRFETASAMAMDIKRYLDNEPVMARPPSNLYRLQKLVRRNKTAFAAVGAVAAALIVGLALSLYLFVREREARHRAERAEREQSKLRQEAEAGRALEVRFRAQAELGKKYSDAGIMLSYQRPEVAEQILAGAPLHPAGASIFNVIGMMHAVREKWPVAATNYAKVVALLPDDDSAYHLLAALLVQTGDVESYRRHCDVILSRFSGTTNGIIAERCARDCLILPPRRQDMASISKWVETAIAERPEWPYAQFVKGLAEYRQGRPASAGEWMQKVLTAKGEKYREVQAHMVLAMAQHQLKQTEEARATLAMGRSIAAAKFPKPDANWHDWIFAHALMREATALVQPEATNAGDVPR